MTDDTENSERAAERLEAALERIARFARARIAPPGVPTGDGGDPTLAQLAAGLDAMIERLRAGLADK